MCVCGGAVHMWEVGFWLHRQLWGTKVCQGRKWLDLPIGRQQPPLLWTSWVTTSAYEGQRSRLLLIQAARQQECRCINTEKNNNVGSPRRSIRRFFTSNELIWFYWFCISAKSHKMTEFSHIHMLKRVVLPLDCVPGFPLFDFVYWLPGK